MDEKKLRNIFLSASIPTVSRDPKYYETCDITAIRDAIIALTSVVLTTHRLIWGGHPAITPIISRVLTSINENISERVVLYQSEWYNQHFPQENKDIPSIVYTKKKDTIEDSWEEMRNHMIGDNKFAAAFFIGGMEGVEEEYAIFKHYHPYSPTFPIASTGAAAKIIYDNHKNDYDENLENNLAYMSLFREILKNI